MPVVAVARQCGFIVIDTRTEWKDAAARLEKARRVARSFADLVRSHYGNRVSDIRLFGSAARGDWMETSDVDILVLLDTVKTSDREWLAMTARVTSTIG